MSKCFKGPVSLGKKERWCKRQEVAETPLWRGKTRTGSVSPSVMSDSFVILWTVAQQAPLSMGFPRQEYWKWLPFPSPGYLPHPGIESVSPAIAGGLFTIWATRKGQEGISKKVKLCVCVCVFGFNSHTRDGLRRKSWPKGEAAPGLRLPWLKEKGHHSPFQEGRRMNLAMLSP